MFHHKPSIVGLPKILGTSQVMIYPLVNVYSLLLTMAIEILDLPMKNMVIFQIFFL